MLGSSHCCFDIYDEIFIQNQTQGSGSMEGSGGREINKSLASRLPLVFIAVMATVSQHAVYHFKQCCLQDFSCSTEYERHANRIKSCWLCWRGRGEIWKIGGVETIAKPYNTFSIQCKIRVHLTDAYWRRDACHALPFILFSCTQHCTVWVKGGASHCVLPGSRVIEALSRARGRSARCEIARINCLLTARVTI